MVENVLGQLPVNTQLPWHRVVNSQGRISFTKHSSRYIEQKQRLLEEGIIFSNEKIPCYYFVW
jgi:methylated-DNA-protein-cysteine methyltransferase-like protein